VRSYTYDPDGNATSTGSGPTTDLRFAGGQLLPCLAGGAEGAVDGAVAGAASEIVRKTGDNRSADTIELYGTGKGALDGAAKLYMARQR
jgi:hypothetical protein